MAGLINQFISVLEEQLVLYEKLVELSETKKSHIINNNIDGLSAVTSLENTTVGRLQRLDRSRVSILRDIAIVLNQDEKNLTLTALANIIEGQPDHPRLTELITQTKDVIDRLKTANSQNRMLIENSLEYIDFTMNVIRSSLMPGPSFYTSSGQEIGNNRGFFDAKQ